MIIIGHHTCGTWYHSLIALSNICRAAGSYIRKVIVCRYTYSDAQCQCIFLAISKRNLVCKNAQISTDLNISKGIMSFNNSSYKFLVPGNFGNPYKTFVRKNVSLVTLFCSQTFPRSLQMNSLPSPKTMHTFTAFTFVIYLLNIVTI